jgi:hypothetical protein
MKNKPVKRKDISHEFDSDFPSEAAGKFHIVWGEQRFSFMGIEQPSEENPFGAMTWMTDCLGCGEEIQVQSKLTFDFPPLRCPDCRKEWIRETYGKRE